MALVCKTSPRSEASTSWGVIVSINKIWFGVYIEENNEFGRWIHPILAATSMAFLLTILDKAALVASSRYLIFCVYFYSLSLVLNSLWSFIYFVEDSNKDISKMLRSNFFTKGLDNLSNWSFLFATISLLVYLITRTSSGFVQQVA